MKSATYSVFALLLAGIMVSAGLVVATLHDNAASVPSNKGAQNSTEQQNEGEMQIAVMAAGGGGWFMVTNATGTMFKDTFGFYLNATQGSFNESSLLFQAREVNMTIHATEFDSVTLDNTTVPGNWTAKATGKAMAGGEEWTFSLQVTDIGSGSMDRFMLVVTNSTTTLTWQTNGLGGGNIWVMTRDLDEEEQGEDEQNDDEQDDDIGDVDEEFMGAVGAGYFMVKNASGVEVKDIFAFFLDARQGFSNNSQLFFGARDVGLSFRSVEFDSISLDNTTVPGHMTAQASGIVVAGGKNWTFQLQVTDMAKNGSADLFKFAVTNSTETLTWTADGLGAGNIVVLPFLVSDELEDMLLDDETGELQSMIPA